MSVYDTARPYAASYVLIKKAGKYAFVLRSNTDWMNHHYGLPSGKVEHGEDFRTAAIREAKEEAGIDIKPEDLKFVMVCHRSEPNEDMSWVDVYFEVIAWEGEVTNAEPDKHSELAWFSPDELPENIIPSVRYQLEQVAKGNAYSEYWFN